MATNRMTTIGALTALFTFAGCGARIIATEQAGSAQSPATRTEALSAQLLRQADANLAVTYDLSTPILRAIASAPRYAPSTIQFDFDASTVAQGAVNVITGDVRYYYYRSGAPAAAYFDPWQLKHDPTLSATTWAPELARAVDGRQVIPFSPSAPLQRAMTLDERYYPDSAPFQIEFTFDGATTCVLAQRAHRLDMDSVRVYYTDCAPSDSPLVQCLSRDERGGVCAGERQPCPDGNGRYCNAGLVAGHENVLDECDGNGQSVTPVQLCANGCVVEAAGSADHCRLGVEGDPCLIAQGNADCAAGFSCVHSVGQPSGSGACHQ